jgi:hypothetical protein
MPASFSHRRVGLSIGRWLRIPERRKQAPFSLACNSLGTRSLAHVFPDCANRASFLVPRRKMQVIDNMYFTSNLELERMTQIGPRIRFGILLNFTPLGV